MGTLIRNATLITFDRQRRVFEGGDLRVSNEGRIAAIGRELKTEEGDELIEAERRVLLPGLINAHTHLYSTLARGAAPVGPAGNFTEVLRELWWPLDRALELPDIELSAQLGLIGALKSGVTTVIDHHASEGAIDGSLGAIAGAARSLGLRLATCFEVTDRDGPEIAAAGIDENERFAQAVAADPALLGGTSSLAAMLGLHASFTLRDETLERCSAVAGKLGGLLTHIHLAEDRADVSSSKARFGAYPVDRLERFGLLRPGSILAHGIYLDDEHRRRLVDSGVFLVHNPSSNMNNAVGRSDLRAHLAAGLRMGLGSDGMNTDIQRELATAYLLLRHGEASPAVGGDEAAAMFLDGNQAIADQLFPGGHLGRLEEGGAADLVLLDSAPFTPVTPGNALFHLIYGDLGAQVSDVMVGGRWALRDRALTAPIDEAALRARGRELAAALWSRMPTKRQEEQL